MISDVILLCALTAELTQSYTHGTCVRGYTHLRHKHFTFLLPSVFSFTSLRGSTVASVVVRHHKILGNHLPLNAPES